MFRCPVGVWVIEQRAIMLNATVRSPTVINVIAYEGATYIKDFTVSLFVYLFLNCYSYSNTSLRIELIRNKD